MITGGAGFIGSYIAEELVRRHIPAFLYDAFVQYFTPFEEQSELYRDFLRTRIMGIRGKVGVVRGDTRNSDELRRAVLEQRPTHIIHLAAVPLANLGQLHSDELVTTIVAGTVNLLEIIRDVDFVERFVYISSSMVYGDFETDTASEGHPLQPLDIYGGAKLSGEVMTRVYGRTFGCDYTIIRPSAVYGPTDVNRRVVQIYVENALRGLPLRVRGADETRLDFTYVSDLAEGVVAATFAEGARNETFNITRGEGRTLGELVALVREHSPRPIEVLHEPYDPSKPRRGGLDIDKARRVFGYTPQVSLEEGVQRYLEFSARYFGKE